MQTSSVNSILLGAVAMVSGVAVDVYVVVGETNTTTQA
jgi:hypothetical protein